MELWFTIFACSYTFSVYYSLAVSVKMNILLYAPGWLVLFMMSHGVYSSVLHITVYCGLPQVSGIF